MVGRQPVCELKPQQRRGRYSPPINTVESIRSSDHLSVLHSVQSPKDLVLEECRRHCACSHEAEKVTDGSNILAAAEILNLSLWGITTLTQGVTRRRQQETTRGHLSDLDRGSSVPYKDGARWSEIRSDALHIWLCYPNLEERWEQSGERCATCRFDPVRRPFRAPERESDSVTKTDQGRGLNALSTSVPFCTPDIEVEVSTRKSPPGKTAGISTFQSSVARGVAPTSGCGGAWLHVMDTGAGPLIEKYPNGATASVERS